MQNDCVFPSLEQPDNRFLLQEAGLKALGADGLFFFSSLDTDHDLYLSPEEFKPIAEKLTGIILGVCAFAEHNAFSQVDIVY